jgi:hypothetical protein
MYGDMLSNNTERVFTTSWSCTEVYGCSTSTMDSRHAIFNNMLGEGWTLIAASGDRGSADDCNFEGPQFGNSAHESVAYPGSDYDVLAAGGTQLQMYTNGTWDYEHGWQGGFSTGSCKGNGGGSGGGVSSYYGKPGFQSYSYFPSGANRETPDLALNALGIGQSLYIGGKLTCCANGTSIVAPELAGFFAQENAYLNYIGNVCGSGSSACTPVGNPMPFFYPVGVYNDASHNPFYDMTGSYCNDNDVTVADSLGYYCDATGYDQVTGWGSANMLQLAWAINWYLIPANGTPSTSFSGPTTGQWYSTDQQISWTINDYGGGTYPGTGIAGFTQGWDSMPPDSFSKPHGGTGDTFWSGPEYPNYTDGCMTLVGNSVCPGGVSQGCHTAHVRGWNNQGWTTGDNTYGPVCYDTVAPTTVASTSGTAPTGDGWYTSPVKVTLTATDPGATADPATGSGVKATYYEIDTGACYPPSTLGACTRYSGPFTVSTPGAHYIYSFSEDNAGNWESPSYIWVYYDDSTPSTTLQLSPASPQHDGWYNTPVSVSFSATETNGPGVATTWWADNGFNCVPVLSQLSTYCNAYGGSAFSVTHNGANTLYYFSEDASDRLEPLHYVTFYLDDIPPQTSANVTGNGIAGDYRGPVTVTLASKDNLSGVAGTFYYVNGHGPQLYTSPIVVSYSGDVNIGFFAVDWAGNFEPLHSVKFRDFPAEIVP